MLLLISRKVGLIYRLFIIDASSLAWIQFKIACLSNQSVKRHVPLIVLLSYSPLLKNSSHYIFVHLIICFLMLDLVPNKLPKTTVVLLISVITFLSKQ